MPDLETLLTTIRSYLPHGDLAMVEEAYRFATRAHDGQHRQSGEPYIEHPLAAALILAGMQLDLETIMAALLHDVPEDTSVTLAEIETRFGPTVARLVDGVTKLGHIKWTSPDDQLKKEQAENLRKMFLAMAEDVRVVLIKLADRLHNIRTIQHLPHEKQRRIAEQTLEIYAPLANRLGIWQIKWELEDRSFHVLNPLKYREIASMLAEKRESREQYLQRVIAAVQEAMAQAGIEAEISGRSKHLYSIYKKMERKSATLDQIYDTLAVRIVVNEIKDCYGALGVIHSLWRPIPGEFDDYVATPKESMYQSLHTAVLALDARPLEIQIRTREMHEVAEYGIAAHWRYKEGSKRDTGFEAKVAWLRRLLDWRDEVSDAQEFVDSLKSDMFQDQVYVFTPKGDIYDLPAGATPIDFAYRIHTEVGHQCIGAKVNDRMVPLDYTLRNGEVVRILTGKQRPGPSRDWLNSNLNYVKTANAREKIRQWFRRQERDENIAHGREVFERELKRLGLEAMSQDDVLKLFSRYPKIEDLYHAIGYGAVSTAQIAAKLVQAEEERELKLPAFAPSRPAPGFGLAVKGVSNILTTVARCCKPMPGDAVVGYITRGRGITVHRADCHNLNPEREPERLLAVEWEGTPNTYYPVQVRVEALDRVGLLRDITTLVADEKINMSGMQMISSPGSRTIALLITLDVTGIQQLSRVLARMEGVRDVYEARRETGRVGAKKTAEI